MEMVRHNLRLPDGVRDKLAFEAQREGRSLNNYLVMRVILPYLDSLSEQGVGVSVPIGAKKKINDFR